MLHFETCNFTRRTPLALMHAEMYINGAMASLEKPLLV
jgi:hypothetical protein